MPTDTWWNLNDEKRRSVTTAALVEFGARGFSAGSLNVIAREAGIAKGSLFQYFEDKLDLFATVCQAASADVEATVLDGIELSTSSYFDGVRALVVGWLRHFREHPVHRAAAYAAAHEIDAEARAAVAGVTNSHHVALLRPLAERSLARNELRPDIDIDVLVAMTVLVLRHLNSAPFYEHLDPVLGLYGKSEPELVQVAMQLVDALERSFANVKRSRRTA